MTWPPDPNAPPDPDIQAFFAAIREAGDDTTPRLVFADWLEERGDPRAELVRLQVVNITAEEEDSDAWTAAFVASQNWDAFHVPVWFGRACYAVLKDRLWLGAAHVRVFESGKVVLNSPGWAGFRKAILEGWVETFELHGWEESEFLRAESVGLFKMPSRLSLTGVGDPVLRCLANSTNAVVLNLGGGNCIVTDEGIAALSGLRRLRELGLYDIQPATGTGLRQFTGWNDLAELGLWACSHFEAAETFPWPEFPSLRRLSVTNCPRLTTDAGLAEIGKFNSLRSLQLPSMGLGTGFSDTGLGHLGRLTSLEELDLWGNTQVTGAGVQHLYGLQSLRKLNLGRCSLRGADTRALKKALPNCEIIRR